MIGDNMQKFEIPAERLIKVVKKSVIALVLLFIPILQIYSAVVAFPLFIHPAINATSSYMEYSFAYFFPTSLVTVAIFAIYYLVVFYFIELLSFRGGATAIGKFVGRIIGRLTKKTRKS